MVSSIERLPLRVFYLFFNVQTVTFAFHGTQSSELWQMHSHVTATSVTVQDGHCLPDSLMLPLGGQTLLPPLAPGNRWSALRLMHLPFPDVIEMQVESGAFPSHNAFEIHLCCSGISGPSLFIAISFPPCGCTTVSSFIPQVRAMVVSRFWQLWTKFL